MYAISDLGSVPTKLKRVSVVFDEQVHQALVAYAARSKRSLSNAVSVLVEQMLVTTGDLAAPIPKAETRGGSRPGSGRKPKSDESDEGDESDETTE